MRTTSIQMTGLLAGSLLMGSAVDAAFTGYEGSLERVEIQGQDWDVWRVYATLDNPGDTVEILSGNAANPVFITTSSGSFYQDPFGADIEHNALFEGPFPDLAHDSYVTIGSTDSNAGAATSTQGLAGNWGASALTLTNGGWFRTPGDLLTTQVATPGGNSGVLIGQFTVECGSAVDGLLRLFVRLDGSPQQLVGTTFSFFAPCPGACCLPDLSCRENVLIENCVAAGGDFIGLGTLCTATACDGACCFDAAPGGKDCVIASESDCVALPGGVFLGAESPCPAQIIKTPIHISNPDQWSHVITVVSLCPDFLEGVGPCVENPTKIDAWMTADDGASCQDFSSPDACSIPPGFFGTASEPFNDIICFVGDPIGVTDVIGLGPLDYGEADTLVARTADPFDRCELPGGPPADPVAIEIVALSLVSVGPIEVTFSNGQDPQDWDVRIELSDTATQPGGTLTATKEHCNGGKFDSMIAACPKFVFTRVSDGTEVELDSCTMCNAAGIMMITTDQDWVHDADPGLGLENPVCSTFLPGLEERTPTQACDCNDNAVRDTCDIEQGFRDCNNNGIPDTCEPAGFCPSDTDCNLAVDVDDLINVITSWDCTGNLLPCLGDVDGSGTVDVDDLIQLILDWGSCF